MIGALRKVIGDPQQKKLKQYNKKVEEINSLESTLEQLSDEELQQKTEEFRSRIANGEKLTSLQVEAFAVVREASRRVLGLRPFDVQLIGGLALSDNDIAEMATGEGKTLVAALPSYLHALEGKGVHVITVNEYLAARDRNFIGQVHEFLGLTVGLNISQTATGKKQAAYQSDITYGTASEFGFDYLRDHMAARIQDQVQRTPHFALIDEIDSVLLDEAKTPLIIAGKTDVHPNLYHVCARMAKTLTQDWDYTYDPVTKTVNFTDEGISRVERAFGIDNLYDLEHQTLYHFMLQALRARAMFTRDVEYIVKNDEIHLVDMYTGRVMQGRTFSEGLHQAIEAKEGLHITQENKPQATMTVQNYFRMYDKLAGMTGTAKSEEEEFRILYGMDVLQIPTNKPRIRTDHEDIVFETAHQKYEAAADEVAKRHQTGQPVLLGTTSIIQSETLARYLDERQVPYELLNAKSVENEARLISLAGQKDQVTLATNMAGRGTDIMLGEGVAELGGLCVIGTEKHENRRIDDQLRGRSGRQGDPGETMFFIALEDEMFLRFADEELEKLQPKLQPNENGEVTNHEVLDVINKAQMACESAGYSVREYTLKMDDVVNEQRNAVYEMRENALKSEDITELVVPMIENSLQHLLDEYCPDHELPEEWQTDELFQQLPNLLTVITAEKPAEIESQKDIKNVLAPDIQEHLSTLKQAASNRTVHEKLKRQVLMAVDTHWIEHIEAMSRLKEGIGLRGYQEDPMRVYTREGYELFLMMYKQLEYTISLHAKQITQPFAATQEDQS
ncbi:preprotein translocase subunit SecA [Salsuginibacillus halophilus]|uniref:Protein translocase subunit SecA n=1 Tax=Salsuginibacillus halophilus TaxID=517424 RepID=A0A2P8HQM5_9BACI|nr:accessory Sec system translocase SecA2 [Salsuginibacillus halophilus]PSL48523.1 preprotein translocase subunit SecA [Salsuginibacillus halophilus]